MSVGVVRIQHIEHQERDGRAERCLRGEFVVSDVEGRFDFAELRRSSLPRQPVRIEPSIKRLHPQRGVALPPVGWH